MKFKTLLILFITGLIIVIVVSYIVARGGGCAEGGKKEVLARIDHKYTITLKDFNGRISKLPKRYQEIINKNKREFLDEVITDTLLYNEALRRKLHRDSDVKKVIEEAKKKILIARLLKDEIEDKVIVNEKEIEDYYNANKEKFTMPEVLRASHILVKTEKEAKDILSELSKGRNFEDLAREQSVDPTSKVGGDIGYFTHHQLLPEFEQAAFKMQVGEVSDVVKTKFGYHVIKLTERREPRVKELTEVQPAIEQSLTRLKKRTIFNGFASRLKEKSKISINNDLLKAISEQKQEKPEEKPTPIETQEDFQ